MTALPFQNPIPYMRSGGFPVQISYDMSWRQNLFAPYSDSSASILSSIDGVIDFLQSRGVVADDMPSVKAYLADNPRLIPHLYGIPAMINGHFGDTTSKVGIFSDSEDMGNIQEMYIEVNTSHVPAKATELLNDLNREILRAANVNDMASLNIILRFS